MNPSGNPNDPASKTNGNTANIALNSPTRDAAPTTPPEPPRRTSRAVIILLVMTLAIALVYLGEHIYFHRAVYNEISKLQIDNTLSRYKGRHVTLIEYNSKTLGEPAELIAARIVKPTDELRELLPIIGTAALPPLGQPMPPAQLEAIDQYIESNAAVIDIIQRGMTRPFDPAAPPPALSINEPPYLGAIRTLARTATLHIIQRLEQGDHNAAAHTMLGLNKLYSEALLDSRLISYLAARSIRSTQIELLERAANSSGISPIALTRFAASAGLPVVLGEIGRDYLIPIGNQRTNDAEAADFRAVLQTELGIGHAMFNNTYGSADAHHNTDGLLTSLIACRRFHLQTDAIHLGYLRSMRLLIETCSAPPQQYYETLYEALQNINDARDFTHAYARQQIAPFATVFTLDALITARDRAAYTAFLVLDYHQRNGQLPDSLADITDHAPLLDPYTAQPLLYRKLDTGGFVVYSTGEDQTDNNGQRTNPAGLDFAPGADIPFTILRLPTP